MAKKVTLNFLLIISTIFLTNITNAQVIFEQTMVKNRVEKLTHLHFYFHDTVTGKSPTAVQITNPSGSYSNKFGTIMMTDDPLTMEPGHESEEIGRAQGLYGYASQEEPSLLMVLNYVFTKGKYNGSSIAILGRNPYMNDVREFPILGGTGLFRFARGFALAHTNWANSLGDAIVEYNVYVYHF